MGVQVCHVLGHRCARGMAKGWVGVVVDAVIKSE
jgi:hypothetical protein